MHAALETYASALVVERRLALKHAAHQAPLLEAAKRSRSAPTSPPRDHATARCGYLTPVVGFLRWVVRPATRVLGGGYDPIRTIAAPRALRRDSTRVKPSLRSFA